MRDRAAAGIVLGMRKGGRPLTPDEAKTVRNALGPRARTDLLRIVERGSFLNTGNVAITAGHTVFVSPKAPPLSRDLLVHEATHTTQFDRVGPAYLLRALAAQAATTDAITGGGSLAASRGKT